MIEEPPSTIHEMLELVASRYGLLFPAADLFRWGQSWSRLAK